MNLKFPQLVGFTAAIILIYAAVKNVNPKDIVVNVLSGKGLPAAGSASDSYNLPAKTPVTYADGGQDGSINGNGQYIPPTDSTTKQPNKIQVHSDAYVAPYPSYPVTSV